MYSLVIGYTCNSGVDMIISARIGARERVWCNRKSLVPEEEQLAPSELIRAEALEVSLGAIPRGRDLLLILALASDPGACF